MVADRPGRTRWIHIGLCGRAPHGFTSPPHSIAVAPDLQTTLGWMFDAALAHEAVDGSGTVVASAVPGIIVESVEILDAASGPIVAVVSSPEDGLAAYEIIVERERLNWRVIATRLSSER